MMLVASGPDRSGGEPGPSVAPVLTFRAMRSLAAAARESFVLGHVGVSVPSGGRIGSQGAFPSTWRVQDRSGGVRSVFAPKGAATFSRFAGPSGYLAKAGRSGGSSNRGPIAVDPADDCAPLTASAVRQVISRYRPEGLYLGFTRRVFRRCCGHRFRPDWVEISLCHSRG